MYCSEDQGSRVDAVAQAGGSRPVGEHVAEVGVATAAQYLGAAHAMADVRFRGDVVRLDRLPEAGPAAAGFVLGLRAE